MAKEISNIKPEERVAMLCRLMLKLESPGGMKLASREFRLQQLETIITNENTSDRAKIQALRVACAEMVAYHEAVRDIRDAIGASLLTGSEATGELKDADMVKQKADAIKQLDNQYGPCGGPDPEALDAKKILNGGGDGKHLRDDLPDDGVDSGDEPRPEPTF